MTGEDDDGSDGDTGPADGLELLADGTRVAILRTLVERVRESPEDPTLQFGELRDRVGMRDSGNFNYHLQKLEGQFLRDTGEGYRIAVPGVLVYIAVQNGVYNPRAASGRERTGDDCPECGEPLWAFYPDGRLTVGCSNGHDYGTMLPTRVAAEREDPVGLVGRETRLDVERLVDGTCPVCYARLDDVPDVDTDETVPRFRIRCPRCAANAEFSVVTAARLHPTVTGFYHDHGVDVRSAPPWAPAFTSAAAVSETAVDSAGEYTVTVELDDERVVATLDERLRVVDAERSTVE
jgi:ssDNA-binding Zn-finger/Zn-ribbon topoisomerase 1